MPVRIRIYGKEATFSQGCWNCDDDSLQAMLQGMADPRALSQAQEHEHALYAAGRFGGLIATPLGWEAAPHPEAEIKLEDFAPGPRPERAGWLSFLRKKK
ncbi:hypothetical protein [Deinococcus frigens]|uniref:hypothetical protein n=1 Tax=Deinococcus frigens TaxID=249403 RepID=UPI0004982470|nr:hypothetical protein [Deinococcus frigens]